MEKKHRILLVDDEANVLSALARSFRKESYEIETAASAMEAMNLLCKMPFDLIISDYKMPRHNGVEFLRQVAADYPDTIRIILTGHADMDAAIEAINEGGVYRFLTKPWNDEELRITIRLALEHLHLQRENRALSNEIQKQTQLLKELEAEHPGISRVKKDENGAILI